MLYIRNFLLLLILNHSQLRTLLNNHSNCTNNIWQLGWSERIIWFQKTGKRYIDFTFIALKKAFYLSFCCLRKKEQVWNDTKMSKWFSVVPLHGGRHVKITWLAEHCLLYVGNIIFKQIYEMSPKQCMCSRK